MPKYIVLAAMKGEFLSHSGNVYENFQMMGYVEAASTQPTPLTPCAPSSMIPTFP